MIYNERKLFKEALTEQTCKLCKVTKPMEAFGHEHGVHSGRSVRCKKCMSRVAMDARRIKKAKDPIAFRKNTLRIQNKHRLRKNFGLTEEAFNGLFMAQGGVCAVCQRLETGTSGPLRTPKRLAVDHDHNTGNVRGLLCGDCNIGLGTFEDNPDRLRRAANYLEERRT